ncbi:DUF1566 domain-containing protein [Pseudoduganella sp. RAF19]|uniref:hypothetical protein n=1 Tax=Bacteria TaxID=2 RepID=UPI003F9C6BDD
MNDVAVAIESTQAVIPVAVGAAFAGGIYAGIIRGVNGAPDQHLILLDGDEGRFDWNEAIARAASLGGELPTRREQALLFANLPEHFQQAWYWSGEQHADYSDYAWDQYFDDGYQDNGHSSYAGRARAVRRLPI